MRAVDAPLHRKADIDDIFVAGQHQAFFRHGDRRVAGQANTDIDGRDVGDRRRVDRFDRERKFHVKAGFDRADELAETQHDALFVDIDPVERAVGDEPQDHETDQDERPRAAARARAGCTAATAAARKHLPELLLRAPDQFIEIGRLIAAAGRPLPPRTPIAAATASAALPAAAAVLIAPGHRYSFDCEMRDRLETLVPGVI